MKNPSGTERWQYGVRVLDCKDEISREFVKGKVAKILPPRADAKLDEISRRAKGGIWISNADAKCGRVLEEMRGVGGRREE